MGRGALALFFALAAMLAAAGCGSGSDGGRSISKEEFIAKADAICKKGNERMEAGFGKVLAGSTSLNPSKLTAAQEQKLINQVMIPSLKREVAALRKLGVPEDGEEKVEAMLAALEEGIETAARDPEAVTNSSDAVFGIASRIAGEYGLEVCSRR